MTMRQAKAVEVKSCQRPPSCSPSYSTKCRRSPFCSSFESTIVPRYQASVSLPLKRHFTLTREQRGRSTVGGVCEAAGRVGSAGGGGAGGAASKSV